MSRQQVKDLFGQPPIESKLLSGAVAFCPDYNQTPCLVVPFGRRAHFYTRRQWPFSSSERAGANGPRGVVAPVRSSQPPLRSEKHHGVPACEQPARLPWATGRPDPVATIFVAKARRERWHAGRAKPLGRHGESRFRVRHQHLRGARFRFCPSLCFCPLGLNLEEVVVKTHIARLGDE